MREVESLRQMHLRECNKLKEANSWLLTIVMDLKRENDFLADSSISKYENDMGEVTVIKAQMQSLRKQIEAIPIRREPMGGQTTSYIARDDVMGWFDNWENLRCPK